MAFIESQLLFKVSYGLASEPSFVITRVALFSGIVARNAETSLPLFRFDAPYQSIGEADHAVLYAAFIACKAGLHGFRFKDWADYQLTAEVIGTAAGGADETMQLIKTYTFGSEDTERNIKKPTGQVSLFEDGAPLASTTDTTTGIVTFTSSAGKVITATGEFDVPVMFMNDTFQSNFNQWQAHSTDVNLLEDRSA
jgi:uncharacterized protein (TIGR02217 family)